MNAISNFNATEFSQNLGQTFNMERVRAEFGNIQNRFANLRSIPDFFDYRRFSRPNGWMDAQARINFNLGYFSTNYAILFTLLSLYSLLTNLNLLFVIIFVVVGMTGISYLGGEDLRLPCVTLTSANLYTILFVIAVPWVIFASQFIGTVMWLIGASGITILGHAACMDRPIESAFGENQV